MNFESYIPMDEDESVFYCDEVVIDSCGVDLKFFGNTYSASFQDIRTVDLALAILEDDFEKETASQVDLIGRIGHMDVDAMERSGFAYLKAAQKLRNTKAAHPASQLVSA